MIPEGRGLTLRTYSLRVKKTLEESPGLQAYLKGEEDTGVFLHIPIKSDHSESEIRDLQTKIEHAILAVNEQLRDRFRLMRENGKILVYAHIRYPAPNTPDLPDHEHPSIGVGFQIVDLSRETQPDIVFHPLTKMEVERNE